MRIDVFEGIQQERLDGQTCVPLAVGGHDEPRRLGGRGAREHRLVGRHVLVPQAALIDVAGVVLPMLVGSVQPLPQPALLLVGGDVQHHFDDADAAIDEPLLEGDDGVVAALDLVGRRERPHPADEDVLVVRPVEHPDEAGCGHTLLDAPQEVVRELLGRRLLERGERDALRIDRSDHVADDAALARGVHRLQHQQHRRSALFDTALRVEALLQLIELVRTRLEVALPLVFVAVVARSGCRIEIGESEPRADAQEVGGIGVPVLLASRGHLHIMARAAGYGQGVQRARATSMICRPTTRAVSAWSSSARVATRTYSQPYAAASGARSTSCGV